MGIGFSLLLIAIGAILKWAVDLQTNGFNWDVIGVILMVVGVVGLLWSFFIAEAWSHRGGRRYYDDVP